MPLIEDTWRRLQTKGKKDPSTSFAVRPLTSVGSFSYDSLLHDSSILHKRNYVLFAKGKGLVRLLPAVFQLQYNSHHPYGWNDGAMIPSKGLQSQLAIGIFAKLGRIQVQLRPELVYAQNQAFTMFSSPSDTLWKLYYTDILNLIDAPERFGNHPYMKIFPGQSSIRFNVRKFSIGVSTENLWWGPGVRNALLMSNNAPGFPHLTFNTTSPVSSPVGSFEGQLISGFLAKSGFLPPDTNRMVNGEQLYIEKPAGNRYLNGIVLSWQPKWIKGLFLGFSRVFNMYKSDVPSSFRGYLPVIGHFFKGSVSDAANEDSTRQDQLLSFFFRFLLSKEKMELYAEFGKNDHSGNMRDLLLEPEHSRAYIIGLRKLFETGKDSEIEFFSEFTNLQRSLTTQLRGSPTWYIHHLVRDGYTQKGQVIGAGIGPGSSSQAIGLNWLTGIVKTGVLFERLVHNNDFYYYAFRTTGDYWSHWVDLSVTLNKSWRHKRLLYDARLSVIKSLNYEWQHSKDVKNLQAALSVSYLF